MMSLPSNIRVSIQFRNSVVFAGEDVDCTITFRNVASRPTSRSTTASAPNTAPRRLPAAARRQSLQGSAFAPSASQSKASRSDAQSATDPAGRALAAAWPRAPSPRKGHGRSLSILSLASEASAANEQSKPGVEGGPRRPHGHARSQSLQPSHNPLIGTQTGKCFLPSAIPLTLEARVLQTGSPTPTPNIAPPSIVLRGSPRPDDPSPSSESTHSRKHTRRASSITGQDFAYPPVPSSSPIRPDLPVLGHPPARVPRRTSPLSSDGQEGANPITRIISENSAADTPRSSVDIYSGSNESNETLASEYPAQFQRPRNGHFRVASKLVIPEERDGPESLTMGYAQVAGQFTLDGSLVNQAPFEEVKRKGVVGGSGGGGVVGIERKKRDTGIFGSLGFSNFGESIGGLLGGAELSSIKEMRSIASSKAIPLLSTPQSVLFIDLTLATGEERSYVYSFTLPKGLPPSHKGRAIRISYHITVGILRPSAEGGQKVRSVDVPFRVFGTVNGDVVSHDLLSPHIYLRDTARTSPLDDGSSPKKSPESNLPSFLDYAAALVEQQQSHSGLLSPTTAISAHLRRASSIGEPATSKEAIELAILRSNQSRSSQRQASTRFSISRSSRPVATVLLSRSAYRLGETFHLVVDFSRDASPGAPPSESSVPVYAVLVTLESSETVDAGLAMRSPQSILRFTRKAYAQQAERVLFTRRLAFALTLPAAATPEFRTSGVGLAWSVRIEFVTPQLRGAAAAPAAALAGDPEGSGSEADDGFFDGAVPEREWGELLEEVGADDRGLVLQGIESMPAETFEVNIPLRVYGAVLGNKSDNDRTDLEI